MGFLKTARTRLSCAGNGCGSRRMAPARVCWSARGAGRSTWRRGCVGTGSGSARVSAQAARGTRDAEPTEVDGVVDGAVASGETREGPAVYESNHTSRTSRARAGRFARHTRVVFERFSGNRARTGNEILTPPKFTKFTKFMAENRRMNHVAIFRVMTDPRNVVSPFRHLKKAACRSC